MEQKYNHELDFIISMNCEQIIGGSWELMNTTERSSIVRRGVDKALVEELRSPYYGTTIWTVVGLVVECPSWFLR
jgi:hypothetical protein